MNRCDLSRIENDLRHAERRHPVDFLEPTPANGDENIGRICEVLSRTFVWIADGSSLEQIGLRATVVLYCVRAISSAARPLNKSGCGQDAPGSPSNILWRISATPSVGNEDRANHF